MDISNNLAVVREKIEEAARRCGRNPDEIKLVAVSKRFPAERVMKANDAGQSRFGENLIQEAQGKIIDLKDRDLEWHLIGHLQSNKARLAAQLFDWIETVDRPKIVSRLDALAGEFGRELKVLMQVNVGEEEQKSGIDPEKSGDLLNLIDQCPNLHLQGLMAIPPYSNDPEASRKYFRKLRELRDELNVGRENPLKELSMGMSHDFEVAIQEGATIVRVGTAIFGPRPD